MKNYVRITGVIFGLVTLTHIWRASVEGWHLAREPVFVLLTLLTAALCIWAVRLLRLSPR